MLKYKDFISKYPKGTLWKDEIYGKRASKNIVIKFDECLGYIKDNTFVHPKYGKCTIKDIFIPLTNDGRTRSPHLRYTHVVDGEDKEKYLSIDSFNPEVNTDPGKVTSKPMDKNENLIPWIKEYIKLLDDKIDYAKHDEVYKWEAFEHFEQNWSDDHDEHSIATLLEKAFAKASTLLSGSHYLPLKMMLEFANHAPAQLSEMFHHLYDESFDLESRLLAFEQSSSQLLAEYWKDENINHYQSDRAMMVYLSMRYPDKYYLYKNRMVNTFCEKTSFAPRLGRGGVGDYTIVTKYSELCDKVRKVLMSNEDLLLAFKRFADRKLAVSFDDDYHLLTQDFIFAVAEILEINQTNYWIFQGNPKEFDIEEGLRSGLTDSWKVTAHKDAIKAGDRFILYITGKDAGCYALGEISSDVYEAKPRRDDALWRAGENGEFAVDVAFTYNLVDSPILKDELLKNKDLAKLKIGNQGTNFSATKKEYETILQMLENLEAKEKNINNKIMKPLNQILYGPPGTGKTYELSSRYFDDYTSTKASVTKEELIKSKIEDKSWWEVLALVLLDLGESHVNDIYQHSLLQLKASLSSSNTVRQTVWGQLQVHTVDACENVNISKKGAPLIFNKTDEKKWQIVEEDLKEQCPELLDLHSQITNFTSESGEEIKRYEFVTFHQSFAYEDFIEGIKPDLSNDTGDIKYIIEDGVFKKMCAKARNDADNNYAIFIDEINRGNVSQIFGELISLIETDKREGQANELSVVLPYSKKVFSVPSNLHIIGTMNTADRSVEALDTALRRRFQFVEMAPKPEVIEEVNKTRMLEGVDLVVLLQTINSRIEVLLDSDHCIGHSYFLHLESIQDLKVAFAKQIIPLLQEYFYGDYGKIALVLGEGFCKANEQSHSDSLFAKVADYDVDAYLEKKIYELKNPIEMEDFEAAIDTLMNKREA